MKKQQLYTKEMYYKKLITLLPKSNFTLDIFNGTEFPCEITCNLCGSHYTFARASNIARRAIRGNKNVCKRCEENIWAAKQQIAKNKAINMLEEKGSIEAVDTVPSWASTSQITWYCKKCNHTFERSPFVMFTQGSLFCPWCETRPFEYDEEMIKEKVKEAWGSEYSFLGITQDNNKVKCISVRHNKCGFVYDTNLYRFLHGYGCSKCRSSHGEKKVRDYLIKYNFIFQEQYIINTNNTNLRLDFYLENNNKKYAIEYNGIQHYSPIDFFGGQREFEKQVFRDKLKKEYCAKNNIILIIIPYDNESILNSDELAQRLRGQVT